MATFFGLPCTIGFDLRGVERNITKPTHKEGSSKDESFEMLIRLDEIENQTKQVHKKTFSFDIALHKML